MACSTVASASRPSGSCVSRPDWIWLRRTGLSSTAGGRAALPTRRAGDPKSPRRDESPGRTPPDGGVQGAMWPRAALGSGADRRTSPESQSTPGSPRGVHEAACVTAGRARAPRCTSAGLATVVCLAPGWRAWPDRQLTHRAADRHGGLTSWMTRPEPVGGRARSARRVRRPHGRPRRGWSRPPRGRGWRRCVRAACGRSP